VPEYRTTVDLPPATLKRNAIQELASIVSDGVPLNPFGVEFSFVVGERSYKAASIEELLHQTPPSTLDRLSFSVNGWSENPEIRRGVSIDLSRYSGNYRIHALDEVWFRGKIQQIRIFFEAHRPWYRPSRVLPALLFGILGTLSLDALLYSIFLGGHVTLGILSGITLFLLALAYREFLNGRLFPHAQLTLSDTRRKLDRDTVLLFFTAFGAIGTVVGVIIQILGK
jgi:hypothetical protein